MSGLVILSLVASLGALVTSVWVFLERHFENAMLGDIFETIGTDLGDQDARLDNLEARLDDAEEAISFAFFNFEAANDGTLSPGDAVEEDEFELFDNDENEEDENGN